MACHSKKTTNTKTNKGDEFPLLSSHNKEDYPFERRSRLSRSPPPAESYVTPAASLDETQQTLVPKAIQDLPSPFDAVISLARKEEEEYFHKCLGTIEVMKAAIEKQKNISQEVKSGVLTLETTLQLILQLRNSWQSCEAVSCSTQTSPSMLRHLQPSGYKRPASSPAEPDADKKKKTGEPTEMSVSWTEVVKGRTKKKAQRQHSVVEPGEDGSQFMKKFPKKAAMKKTPRPRSDALLIKPLGGKSYADVLSDIRQKAKPDEKGAVIKGLRKTRAGDLLVEFGGPSGSKADFGSELKDILGSNASVRVLEPKLTVEVRDLDELTTESEVRAAIESALGGQSEMKIFVSKANSRGQKIAIITLGAKDAAILITNGHIKIGWVNCRVREKLVAPRCFKCLGFGHVANRCSGPDRSKLCFKCGGQDHKASSCTATESCVLCTEAGLENGQVQHSAGSGRCQAYKKALQELRAKKK